MPTPCPICGYDWPDVTTHPVCPWCGLEPREPTLRRSARAWSGVRDGCSAIVRGVGILLTTRGTKRWLVPPALITFAAFVAATWWLWSLVARMIESAQDTAHQALPGEASWWRAAIEWIVERTVLVVGAKLTGMALVSVLGFVVMLWTFSLVYELVCGPFLDEVHGIVEKRWFGIDPRDEAERPRGITPATCWKFLAIVLAAALVGVVSTWWLEGVLAWLAVLGLPLLALAATIDRNPAFGAWLRWRAAIEARTLFVTLQATLISGLMLVFALPLLLVPILGYPLFAIAAGFTTAVSLLDIPMSRRRWNLSMRVSFVFHHLPAVVCFGAVASLLYVVPVIGPLLLVPAASVGGLWLFCRLDKSRLRARAE